MKRAPDLEKVRAAIARRRLTQRQLARLARISKGSVHKVLTGERVSDALARRFAESVECHVDDLFVSDAPSARRIRAKTKAAA